MRNIARTVRTGSVEKPKKSIFYKIKNPILSAMIKNGISGIIISAKIAKIKLNRKGQEKNCTGLVNNNE